MAVSLTRQTATKRPASWLSSRGSSLFSLTPCGATSRKDRSPARGGSCLPSGPRDCLPSSMTIGRPDAM
eukprot:14097035-Alexandrium_andersonii.AAC.1